MPHELSAFRQAGLVLPLERSDRRRPVVDFTNVAYANVGDLLMLMATEEAIARRFPQALFVRQRYAGVDKRFALVASDHLDPTLGGSGLRRRFVRAAARRWVAGPATSHMSPGIPFEAVDALVDLSGYKYFDPGFLGHAVRDLSMFKRAKEAGKAVILMPKAFGPFGDQDSPVMQSLMATVRKIVAVAVADVCFVRDHASLAWLDVLNISRANIVVAPDYTGAVAGKLRAEHAYLRGRVCIIPNHRLVERVPGSSMDRYVAFLADLVGDLRGIGLDPYCLVHDYDRDVSLIAPMRARLGDLEIVREPDPLFTKGLIGTASIVVGSRLHGITSGLAQGVPSIALGWAHKYAALMADYAVPELLVHLPFGNARAEIVSIVAGLIGPGGFRAEVVDRLAKARVAIAEQNDAMWTHIETVIARQI